MNFSTSYAAEEREAGPEGWGLLFSSLSLFFIPYKQFSFQIMRYITILLTLLVALVIANFVEAEAADDSGGTDEPATVEPIPTLRVRSHAIRKHHKRGYPVGMLCASRTTWVSKNKQKIRGKLGGNSTVSLLHNGRKASLDSPESSWPFSQNIPVPKKDFPEK